MILTILAIGRVEGLRTFGDYMFYGNILEEKVTLFILGFLIHTEKKSVEFWKNTFSGSNTKIEFLYF